MLRVAAIAAGALLALSFGPLGATASGQSVSYVEHLSPTTPPVPDLPVASTTATASVAATTPSTLVTTSATVGNPAAATKARFHAAKTFTPALGATLSTTNVKRLAKRDLVVVDGDDTTRAQVAALQSRGAIVLGYLSVGSVETWRSWFGLLRDHRLTPLPDWPQERFTDVANADAQTVLADTITPQLLAKGFDGLFLDVLDMAELYPAQADGMLATVSRIAARVHGAGGVLMAQNADAIIDRYVPLLDGWNREDPTGTYDFATKTYVPTDVNGRRTARASIRKLKAAGLLVTTIDYYASPHARGARRAVRVACKAGALPFVGEIALKRVPAKPQACTAG